MSSFRMVKIFKGIGFGVNIANVLLTIYYNMIIAYSVYYLFLSFTTELPWIKCDPKFASNSDTFIFKLFYLRNYNDNIK